MLLSITVTVMLVMARPFSVTIQHLSTTLCHHWIDVVCAIIPLLLTGLTLVWLRGDCNLLEETQKEDFLNLIGHQPLSGPLSPVAEDPKEGRNSSVVRATTNNKLITPKGSMVSKPAIRTASSKRVANMLAINLEFLWERVSRFQLFLFSVFFGDLMWLIRIAFLMIGSQSYTDAGSCELVYAIAVNKVRSQKEGGSWYWALLSALGDALFYALVTVFPTIFVLDIIQATLFKKGANVSTQDDEDRNSGFFQTAERIDSKLMKLEDSFEDNFTPSTARLQDSEGNIAATRVKKKVVSNLSQSKSRGGKSRQAGEQSGVSEGKEDEIDYYRASID